MYWCLHDSDKSRRTPQLVDREKAEFLNKLGFGVFWVVNEFEGRRVVKNCSRIKAWFCEIDTKDKPQQLILLQSLPLIPSVVVETRKGFHCYWRVHGVATLDNWKRIVRWGIVPVLGADPKATDVLRLLRAPGFYHMKDPKNPFPVRFVRKSDFSYTEEQMLLKFPSREYKKQRNVIPGNGGFWDQVRCLDCLEAIERLNGHSLMRGERFKFEQQANGNHNIFRTFPSPMDTGCFVDSCGRLGNVPEGSTIVGWLRWYGNPLWKIAKGLKEVFPELVGDKHDGGTKRTIEESIQRGLC